MYKFQVDISEWVKYIGSPLAKISTKVFIGSSFPVLKTESYWALINGKDHEALTSLAMLQVRSWGII